MESLRRPSSGWNAVLVSRNAVESHEALLEEWKYEVILCVTESALEPSLAAAKLLTQGGKTP